MNSYSSEMEEICKNIAVMRNEINNIRRKHQGLLHQHRKDVQRIEAALKDLSQRGLPISTSQDSTPEVQPQGQTWNIRPVGTVVSSWYKEKNGTPRQPSLCQGAEGVIDLGPDMARNFPKLTNVTHALENLSEFSHVWLIFVFHQSCPDGGEFTKAKVAPPRLGGAKVGLFSTRSPHRPNLIGLTLAKLDRVKGTRVHVSGIDLIQGTPILDIKPYIPSYDQPKATAATAADLQVKVSSWICEKAASPRLEVYFTQPALQSIAQCVDSPEVAATLETSIRQILVEDPRSVYRKEKCSDQLYFFTVNGFHVTSWFDGDTVQVLKVVKKTDDSE